MNSALERLAQFPLGTRVVIRYRIDSGLTDALGDLVARNDHGCTVVTRAGSLEIKFDDVQLAKAVPPPPPPRARRMQG